MPARVSQEKAPSIDIVRTRSNSAKSATGSTSSGHRRTLSGNVLARIPFLKPTSPKNDEAERTQKFPEFVAAEVEEPQLQNRALANVLAAQNANRKRKGSLRKTALLATGKLWPDRRNSNPDAAKHSQRQASRFDFNLPDANSSSESHPATEDKPVEIPSTLVHSVFSSIEAYESTTDDGDSLMSPLSDIGQGSFLQPFITPTHSPSPPSSESSGSAVISPPALRRASKRAKSPLSTPQITELAAVEEEWDYSETEWWGWVVLIVTWIVFVVGMGSCLDVWAWAWDVGETPYAPPELEDDPTLPIVGYYPALIILTAVMSWVWVVVAWVGMKYFKHAKIQSDDQ